MRALTLALILANVLYLAWTQLIDVRVSSLDRGPVNTLADTPQIVLASEAEHARSADSESQESLASEVGDVQPPTVAPAEEEGASPQSAELARNDSLACTTIGPFPDLSRAAQAQAALRGVGFEPRQRLEQGELWVGYWVSISGLNSRDDAEQAIRTLTEEGITDVYLMPTTDSEHVVSLGVFSDYQRAQRRAHEVRALGLTPRIEDRTRAGTVYWLDVDLQEPGQAIDTAILQPDRSKILRLEMRGCPAPQNG